MTQKKYDLVVKVGSYTDRNGEEKSRWENIGSVMQSDKGFFMLLKKTFNPAGVPGDSERDSVLVSMFEPKERGQAPQQEAKPAFDDSVPF